MYLIGEKDFAASPPLFDKRSGCYGNGLIDAEIKTTTMMMMIIIIIIMIIIIIIIIIMMMIINNIR